MSVSIFLASLCNLCALAVSSSLRPEKILDEGVYLVSRDVLHDNHMR